MLAFSKAPHASVLLRKVAAEFSKRITIGRVWVQSQVRRSASCLSHVPGGEGLLYPLIKIEALCVGTGYEDVGG